MSDHQARHDTGALPPQDLLWQPGKTAASIRFVNDAQRYVAEGRADAMSAQMLEEAIEAVKTGDRRLQQFLKVEDFLVSGFPI